MLFSDRLVDDSLQQNKEPEQEYVSRTMRWVLVGILFCTLLVLQIVIGIPLIIIGLYVAYDPIQIATNPQLILAQFVESDLAIWLTLAAALVGAFVTLITVLVWPALAQRVSIDGQASLATWFAWQRPVVIPVWIVPVVTLLVMLATSSLVSAIFGSAEVELQVQLFRTPELRVASTLIVATIVPLVEELVFRGALYNAVLAHTVHRVGFWRQHALPFLIVSVLFAGVHLLAGFESVASIVQIVLLSAFITSLRSITGSTIPGVAAHTTWNLVAALGLTLTSILGPV